MKYSAEEVEYLKAKGAPEVQNLTAPENDFLWSAYMEIRRDRPVGMSVGRIPISAIAAWCDFHSIDCPIQRNRIKAAVIEMDAVELSQRDRSNS